MHPSNQLSSFMSYMLQWSKVVIIIIVIIIIVIIWDKKKSTLYLFYSSNVLPVVLFLEKNFLGYQTFFISMKALNSNTIFGLNSGTESQVSENKVLRRRSLLSSTRQTPCLLFQSYLNLNHFLMNGPWTFRKKRLLTCLRKWW